MLRISCLCIVLCTVICSHAYCQVADTAFVATSAGNAVKEYEKFIQGQTGLYNGSEYVYPERTNDEHPFYKEFDWLNGSVEYNGELYDKTAFLYDLTSDNLITEHFYNGEEIVLVKAKVKAFTLEGERFIHLNGTSLLPGLSEPGFYRLYYDGPSRTIARITKAIEEAIESNKVERYFKLKTRIYVLKDGVYHKVSKRSEILKLFKDRKPALRAYAAKEKIVISRLFPSSFAKLAAYYDSLNQPTQ
jgi:hypothetical protein